MFMLMSWREFIFSLTALLGVHLFVQGLGVRFWYMEDFLPGLFPQSGRASAFTRSSSGEFQRFLGVESLVCSNQWMNSGYKNLVGAAGEIQVRGSSLSAMALALAMAVIALSMRMLVKRKLSEWEKDGKIITDHPFTEDLSRRLKMFDHQIK